VIELRTFGALDLRDGDGLPLHAVLVQPKRMAILAYLAVAPPQCYHRRDTLLALFWPEHDAAHARMALRQALHGLRQALGEGVLRTRGDVEVSLDPARLRCDVAAFERALDAGDPEGAVGLYSGPFLRGFFIDAAPEFERWVETERTRLDHRCGTALEELATSAEQRGDVTGAVQWWSRLAEHAPHTARVALRLMRALDAAGDRAAAIRHADQHASLLRRDLDAGPDAEVEALAAQLRAGGTGSELPPRFPIELAPAPAGSTEARDRNPPRRIAGLVVGLAALVLVGLVVGLRLLTPPRRVATADIRPVTSEPGIEFQPAITPDGRDVAFVAGPLGRRRLMLRSAAGAVGSADLILADTTAWSPWLPRWSPDGQAVRFLACPGSWSPWNGQCEWKEVGRLGGPVRSLTVPGSWTTAWSPDGARIAFSRGDSLFTLPSAGGSAVLLAVHAGHSTGLHSLAWSPDGRRIAYVDGNMVWLASGNVLGSSIWLVTAEGGTPAQITDNEQLNTSPVWLDDRHLLFVSSRDGPRGIYVAEVGPQGSRGRPQAVPGAADVQAISYTRAGHRLAWVKLSWEQNIWSFPLGRPRPLSITDGQPVTAGAQVVEEHDLSPDGRRIVYDSDLEGNADIYVLPLDGGASARLTSDVGNDEGPRWSPDGTEIAFYGAHREVFVVPAAGGTPVRLTDGEGSGVNPRWSPSGLQLAFSVGGFGPRELRLVTRGHVGGAWSQPTRVTTRCQLHEWAPDGSGVLCTDSTNALAVISPRGRVIWRRSLRDAYRLRGYISAAFSHDGATLYAVATHLDGRRGIWSMRLRGDQPRLVVFEDDPGRRLLHSLSIGPTALYATVSEYETDVWAMTLRW